MIEVNKQGEVWVFAEQHGGKLEEVPVELMSKGRELADTLKVPLAAVLLGSRVADLCERLGHYGADKVYRGRASAFGALPDQQLCESH